METEGEEHSLHGKVCKSITALDPDIDHHNLHKRKGLY